MADLSYGLKNGKINLQRNYFGSCHGKGPSDGEGGVVKSFVTRATMTTPDLYITSAKEFYDFVKPRLTKNDVVSDVKCQHYRRIYVSAGSFVKDQTGK